MAILREQQLPLPPDLALLIKASVTLEGLGRSLDPDFEMAAAASPFLGQAASPSASWSRRSSSAPPSW